MRVLFRASTRSDLNRTPRCLHTLLELPVRVEAAWLRRGGSLPLGLSILAVFTATPAAVPRHTAPLSESPIRVHQRL